MIRKTNWLKNNWLIVLTIIWFIVGFVLVFIFLSIYKMVNWEVLTGFATWILVGGVAVASWQINQARKSTNAQLTVGYYWKFREDKAVEKLRSIYALGSKAFKDLQANKKKEIDYVLDWLDKLGALVVRNILDKQLAIEVFAGLPALRCWYKLSEYIKEERKNRGYYAENYEAFVRLSLDYFKKAHMPVKLHGTDLVTELQKDELHPRSVEEIKQGR